MVFRGFVVIGCSGLVLCHLRPDAFPMIFTGLGLDEQFLPHTF
jgi:hypothetical protein